MLKLPKGLKKKKKGKKSKKDQELFTEEELQQYKREHQAHPEPEQSEAKTENDDEWSKFAALTTGVDSILKKTQDDLDRIKAESFFKRVPPPSEKKVEEKPEVVEEVVEEKKEEEVEKDPAKQLLNAVVELSDSDDDSEYDDAAFDTTFTEASERPLAYVAESPEEEPDFGPDPFDTCYAEKVIKGPAVSARGKKLVNIGAAVEVLTGKVETASTATKSRRQRRGIQNLLLESFETNLEDGEVPTGPEPIAAINLLDDLAESSEDVQIDLSVSLHLTLLQQQKANQEEKNKNKDEHNVLEEFDVLKKDDTDSLLKDNKPKRPPPPSRPPQPSNLQILLGEEESEEEDLGADPFDTGYVEKIVPKSIDYDDDFDPRAAGEEEASNLTVERTDLLSTSHTDLAGIVPTLAPSADVESDTEFDPFDTSAVNAVIAPGKTELKYLEKELLENSKRESLSDDDFDPRAGEEEVKQSYEDLKQRKSSLSLQITPASTKLVSFAFSGPDLLRIDPEASGKNQKPLTPYYNREPSLTLEEEAVEEDPFDTSFVPTIAPSAIELDLIEKEILREPTLRHSLSDPDFDPRAVTPVVPHLQADLFLAPDSHDIKVLTPARSSDKSEEEDEIDPFDTSIAVNILPGSAELKLLEDELIDKRPEAPPPTDILSDTQDNSIYSKILTPQPTGSIDFEAQEDFDPFDTSFASNLAPGETEIKLLESELIN